METADLALLLFGTWLLVLLSLKSLRRPRSHGFYRFFAWETMLLVGVLNRPWGRELESVHQQVAEALLIASLALVLAALVALHRGGRSSSERADDSLYGFERTTRLVTGGIYRYIRHPMYASLLALDWGCFFESPSWAGGALSGLATLFLALTMRADERECLQYFGLVYADYMRSTKRFIPRVF